MSVYKHHCKPGWWTIKISHGRKEKPEYFSHPGPKEAAEIYERELRGIVDRSDPGLLDHFPDFMIAYKNRSAVKTVESLQFSFKHLEAFFGGYKMRHITATLVEQYKAHRLAAGVKKRTVNVELSALSAYVRWMNETHGTTFVPPKLFTRKETKPALPQVLTPPEMAALFTHLDGDVLCIVELMGLCGLRRNEALNLQAADIDLQGREVRILGKGGKWRLTPIESVPLLARLAKLCSERPTGPLFPSPHDPNRARKDIRKSIRTAAKLAGITKSIRPHLLRHSCGAALINGEVDIRVIQDLFGHADLSTTMLYTQVGGKAKHDALARHAAATVATGLDQ